MKTTFTPTYILSNRGCYEREQVNKLSFICKEEITINDIVNSEMPLKDKYWFVINKCELTIRQKQELAIRVASIVLEIYEKGNPENKAPREAIEAAKEYLYGNITIYILRQKRNAAYAAATYATYATCTAATAAASAAAYAAADAACVAADEAYSAATYATYATYAAAAADVNFTQRLFNYLLNFINLNK